MPTPEEVLHRVGELEGRVTDLTRRFEDISQQTSNHGHQLGTLIAKLDQLREDVKEIKQLPYVQRSEFESRVRHSEEQIEHLRTSMLGLSNQLMASNTYMHEMHVSVTKEIFRNTLATYGTLIGVVLMLLSNTLGKLMK
jgi:chromosome segregation ATPase